MGRFYGENVWLGVADCMANVDWRWFLRVVAVFSHIDF
jgi:hypothetical protein